MAVEYHTSIPKTYGNIIEISNDTAKKMMATNHKCFIKILERLQYLAQQGQAIQGHADDESNLIQLLKLRGKGDPCLSEWLEKKEDKYMSHNIQTEVVSIMANIVIGDVVLDIQNGFGSIICDEHTNLSSKEHLTTCI